MEEQAKYHVKERPFHGDYTSPGQGKRPDQYSASAKFLIIVFALLFVGFGLALIFSSCTGPGQMVETGYLVTVTRGIKTDWEKLENTASADSFVFAKTGIILQSDSLIHPRYPFYQFRNGIFDIYVEQKGIYQRRENGKKRWRVYDEQLQAPSNFPPAGGGEKEISNIQ